MNVIDDLQTALVSAWSADSALTVLIGERAVFDAPPKGRQPPYVTILSHDVAPRDGDETPGFAHRMTVHCWSPHPSRKAALEISDRVERIAVMGALTLSEHLLTLRRHIRTETTIDLGTGRARAAVSFRFFTEPKD